MSGNYFFIDGSALTSQIRQLRRSDESFKPLRLCPVRLANYFMQNLIELHAGSYKRFTYYFPKGDETTVGFYLDLPDFRKPKAVRDIHFKFCGEKLKKSAEFEAFVEEKVPKKFRNRFQKSEKGIDIEICCDAFKLAAASRLERLFLLTNDDDFTPLCRTLKEYGANVSIIHLTDLDAPNVSLLKETDSYDVVPRDRWKDMFVEPAAAANALESSELQETESGAVVKADAAPSDLVLDEPQAVATAVAAARTAEPEGDG